MADRLIVCGAAPTPRGSMRADQLLHLDLGGQKQNVDLRLEDISRRLVANVPLTLVDLLEIAAYVFAADQMAPRGGPTMAALGRDWRRRFRLVIPVRNPTLWSRPDVLTALTEALAFMSEDHFSFEFLQHDAPASLEQYLDLGHVPGKQFASDEVLLFLAAWTRSAAC